jgi:hypothetical protein
MSPQCIKEQSAGNHNKTLLPAALLLRTCETTSTASFRRKSGEETEGRKALLLALSLWPYPRQLGHLYLHTWTLFSSFAAGRETKTSACKHGESLGTTNEASAIASTDTHRFQCTESVCWQLKASLDRPRAERDLSFSQCRCVE